MKKVIALAIVLFLPIYFHGCCTQEYHVQIVDFDILVLDNSGLYPDISPDNTISKKALAFAIMSVDSFIVDNSNMDLGLSCYAFSCDEDYIQENSNASVKIFTLMDYSSKYRSGDNIDELFLRNSVHYTYYGRSSYIPAYKPISEISPLGNLFLNDTTALPTPQQFRIEITYSDGATISHDTPVLNLF